MKALNKALARLHHREEGMTGLETAIILIAFVTVAAVFGYAVLSAGIFSADKAKGTIYQGMEEAKSSMEVKGGVIATSAAGTEVTNVQFVVSNAIGEYPIDLTPQGDVSGNNCTVISYTDENQYVEEVEGWTITQLAGADTDNLLEIGEQFLVTVPVDSTDVLTTALDVNTVFTLEIKPPHGATIVVSRRTPAELDSVMDLK
ncbi:MAG: flagellin [Dehalococcoidia bacterium]|nr:flagellin [Dehalococcoidia bacterium]